MSGGSYDYLYAAEPSALLADYAKSIALERMQQRLAALGYARDAAEETYRLMEIIRQCEVRIQTHIDRLSVVWHAVEWWDSGDSGEGNLQDALAEYRSGLRLRFYPVQVTGTDGSSRRLVVDGRLAGDFVILAGTQEVLRTKDRDEARRFLDEHMSEEFGRVPT